MILLNQRHHYYISDGTSTTAVESGALPSLSFQPDSVAMSSSPAPIRDAPKPPDLEEARKTENCTSLSEIAFADPSEEG